jgi:EAL domain-containing protein (putative c-di-GMP-specific phosphodiesterase class I)
MHEGAASELKECCYANRRWCLEGFFVSGGQPIKISVMMLPMRIGRSPSAQFTINHPSVSRVHAELLEIEGCVGIADINSRNGTYVNYQRITGPTRLNAGDFIHLGSCEFRIIAENETLEEYRAADQTWLIKEPGGPEFQRLIDAEAVNAKFQPVVLLDDHTVFAFESLGRGNFPGAPTRPDDLFRVARRYGYSRTLSNIFRVQALRSASELPGHYQMFFNVHIDELREPERFIGEMAQVRDLYPNLSLVAEIPEGSELQTATLIDIRDALRDLGYGMAYDDFGVGQARLVQLTDCPPDYLKFDRALIMNIDTASAGRQKMVKMLVELAQDLGCMTVAEGVETAGESETARQLGFRCGQGYLYGRPMAPDQAFAF